MIIQTVALEVEGIIISGRLYLPDGEPPYPAVCICHGIPSGRPPDPGDGGYPELARRICREGFAVQIFNFRGTGDSGGNLDILGWSRDLKAVIDYLAALPEIDSSRLSLIGFSGGAVVSIYLASKDERVSGVVSCACPAELTLITDVDEPQSVVDHFRSIGAIRDEDFPLSVENWLDDFRLVRSVDHAGGIFPRPLLLLHGSDDELIDVSHARKLYDKAGEPKRLMILNGAGHRLRNDNRVAPIIIDWLKIHYSN